MPAMRRMTLAQWAAETNTPYRTANRWWHRNTLPEGVRRVALPSGRHYVEVYSRRNTHPAEVENPWAGVDVDQLVARLHEEGYYILTHSQARALGIHKEIDQIATKGD